VALEEVFFLSDIPGDPAGQSLTPTFSGAAVAVRVKQASIEDVST
jgi:hypothetical protein